MDLERRGESPSLAEAWLTDREAVRRGRVLIDASSKSSVWYPDAPTATVVIRGYAGELSPKAIQGLAEVLGDFDTELQES